MLHGWANAVAIPGLEVPGLACSGSGVDEYLASKGVDGGGIIVEASIEMFLVGLLGVKGQLAQEVHN